MFQSSREQIRHAWQGLRERGTLRLFAFEFVVVLLGVLAAQVIQNVSQERARQQDAQETLVRLRQQMSDAKDHSDTWRAALPCLQERVEQIMRAASIDGPVAIETTRRPKLNQLISTTASPEQFARIAGEVGTKPDIALQDVVTRIDAITAASLSIRQSWDMFRLLDPSLGRPSPLDRAAARAAGASILTELRSIQFASDMIDIDARIMPAGHPTPFDPLTQTLPVRNCAEIWPNGTAYRKLDPGEKPPY